MKTMDLLLFLGIVSASSVKAESQYDLQELTVSRQVYFSGSCDASGAVELNSELFAVADDEDNVIRVYNAIAGGVPLMQFDLSYKNLLKTTKNQYEQPLPAPLEEMDIEAATTLNGKALWITSHGRDKEGLLAPDRLRFFATEFDLQKQSISLTSPAVTNLLSVLTEHPQLKKYDLQAAASKAPKAVGGLNLEGMTAMPDGKLLLGFRNPIPEENALLLIINNPAAVLQQGSALQIDPPILLNLGGRGVRGISYWKNQYLIAAGHFGEGFDPGLYSWLGPGTDPKRVNLKLPERFNTEAFYTPDDSNEFMLLSDDGALPILGKPCKKLKDANQKFFRGIWVTPTVKDTNEKPNLED